MNRLIFSALLSLFALAACTGSPTNSAGNTVTGSVAGSAFFVASARAFDDGSNETQCPAGDAGLSACFVGRVSIQLGSRQEAACLAAPTTTSNTIQEFASASDLGILLVKANGHITTGTYDITLVES